jgi:hypothetical protein
MKRRHIGVILLAAFFLAAGLVTGKEKTIEKNFSDVKSIKMKLILGSSTLLKGPDKTVQVRVDYTYEDDEYEAVLRQKNSKLDLRELFHDGKTGGEYSKWTVRIPEGVDVDFNSATGDLTLTGVSGKIEGSSGTGDITITGSSGDFEISTGTGNVEVSGSKGEFDLSSGTGSVEIETSTGNFDISSGTGDVKGTDLTLDFEGDFSSGTGDAEVINPKGSGFDLSVSSGTDDATLDMNGAKLSGYFEMTANKRLGRIVSPVKFDKEEELDKGDNKSIRKSVTLGSDTPKYRISTGTGKAILKK